jgi:hypothetical protein
MAKEDEQQSASQTDGEDTGNDSDNNGQQQDETTEDLEKVRKDAKAYGDTKIRAENAETARDSYKQRLIDAGFDPDTGKAKEQTQSSSTGDQKRLDRIELNSLGIKDREEQDLILGAAQRLGVSLSEAASDDVVSAKLEKMREARKTKDATPAPSRTGQSTANVTRLAEKALSTGELPSDPKLRTEVRAEMKRLTKK